MEEGIDTKGADDKKAEISTIFAEIYDEEPISFDENGHYETSLDEEQQQRFEQEILDSRALHNFILSKTDMLDWQTIDERIRFLPGTGKIVYYQDKKAEDPNTVDHTVRSVEAICNNWTYSIIENNRIDEYFIEIIGKPISLQ